ncbi:MAG: ThuA domain-containing protein [Bryobacteraceae bacterium]|nr:ThuA domain-containing protein [Bryobacteraceae bacterium]
MRFLWLLLLLTAAHAAAPKKIVILAGLKSHGPGFHEYAKSAKLLKILLERATPLAKVELHFRGWPDEPTTLDTADSIIVISDGQDGHLGSPVPFLLPERMAIMERQMKRGCGLGLIHFSTFFPDADGQRILAWSGGYFDWQDETGARKWSSAIKTLEATVEPATPGHPALRGLAPFALKEEFYYQMAFPANRTGWKPLLRVPALGGTPDSQTVAWSVQRRDGGRGFGTSMGHFDANWQVPAYRKFFLNLIAWSAGLKVPTRGFEGEFVEATGEIPSR